MATLTKQVSVDWQLSPADLAKFFCEMDGEAQAEFFNAVSEEVATWARPFCFQLQGVLDSAKLNGGGITIMREIGEYAEGYIAELKQEAPNGQDEP